MTDSLNSFHELMQQIAAGNDDAVRRLLDLYGSHVFRAVRRSLSRTIRSKFDSQDFVQSVWRSFFSNRDELRKFESPEQLIAFLSRVAGNKVIDQGRHHLRTDKSNVKRERSLSEGRREHEQVAAPDPSPSEVAVGNELMQRLLEHQPERYRQIVVLRAEGNTYQQIATQLNVNEKTVRRVLDKISPERHDQ